MAAAELGRTGQPTAIRASNAGFIGKQTVAISTLAFVQLCIRGLPVRWSRAPAPRSKAVIGQHSGRPAIIAAHPPARVGPSKASTFRRSPSRLVAIALDTGWSERSPRLLASCCKRAGVGIRLMERRRPTSLALAQGDRAGLVESQHLDLAGPPRCTGLSLDDDARPGAAARSTHHGWGLRVAITKRTGQAITSSTRAL